MKGKQKSLTAHELLNRVPHPAVVRYLGNGKYQVVEEKKPKGK